MRTDKKSILFHRTTNVQFVIINDNHFQDIVTNLSWKPIISQRITERMHACNLNKAELAKRLNLTHQTVSNHLEKFPKGIKQSGRTLLELIYKYASALDCSIEYLLGIVEKPYDIALTTNGYHIWYSLIIRLPDTFKRRILDAYDHFIDTEQIILPSDINKSKILYSDFHYDFKDMEDNSEIIPILFGGTHHYIKIPLKGPNAGGMFLYNDKNQAVIFYPKANDFNNPLLVIKPEFHYPLIGNPDDETMNEPNFNIAQFFLISTLTASPNLYEQMEFIIKTLWKNEGVNHLESFKNICETYSKFQPLYDSLCKICQNSPSKALQNDLLRMLDEMPKKHFIKEQENKHRKMTQRKEADKNAENERILRHNKQSKK